MSYAQAAYSQYQQQQDEAHLNLLRIFHFIWGGLLALMGLLPIFHVAIGIMMLTGTFDDSGEPVPAVLGWMFILFGGFIVLLAEVIAGLNIYSAIQMGKRRRRLLSIVVAGFNCTFMPLGTVLGIFTIIVLMRESVKAAYGVPQPEHRSAF